MPLPAIAWGIAQAAIWGPRLAMAAKYATYGMEAYAVGSAVYDWASPDGGASSPTPSGGAGAGSSGSNGSDLRFLVDVAHPAVMAILEYMAAKRGGPPGVVGVPNNSKALEDIFNQFEPIQFSLIDLLLRLNGLSSDLSDIGGYSLDQAGLDAYDADVVAGNITGDGLIVRFYDPNTDRFSPRLNPHFLVVKDPPFDTVLDARVLLDALNGLYLSKVLRP